MILPPRPEVDHEVVRETGHLTELPAQQALVEASRSGHVVGRELNVRDLTMCHTAPPSSGLRLGGLDFDTREEDFLGPDLPGASERSPGGLLG